jgi:Tfp pilus assembly protein PilX
MSPEERDRLVDLIAQAVIDKIEERERINRISDLIVQRVLTLQAEEAALVKAEKEAAERATAAASKETATRPQVQPGKTV